MATKKTKKRAKSVAKAESRERVEAPDDAFFEEQSLVEEAPPTRERDSRLKALEAVAKRFEHAKPARQVLSVVRAMPTIFPQFDHATRVGGLPVERVMTVHGPSNHGKTLFAIGLGISFLQNASFFHLIDAERTTSITWLEQLYPGIGDHPGFSASRPGTYEEAVDGVRKWATAIGDARAKGQLPKDTSGLVVVDSLRKLVPENFFEKIAKDANASVDGFGGRAAQMKASLNAAWLDELVVILEQTGTSLLFIAREDEQTEGTGRFAKKVVKIGGGRAIVFDSSLLIRIERESWQMIGSYEKKTQKVVGERHRVTISKTKVGGKEGKTTVCHFHSSNGVLSPMGFDRTRDVLDLGIRFGIVKKASEKSSWLTFAGSRWQGEDQAYTKLLERQDIVAEIERACRERFASAAQVEVDEDGVVRSEGLDFGASSSPAKPKDDVEEVFGAEGEAP